MKYWWVNQNKTFKQEHDGNYMWSPKKQKDGKRLQFYENMRLVSPGDIVFSYANKNIRSVGVVQKYVCSANRPENFGSVGEVWDKDGWMVEILWYETLSSVKPKDIINELRPTLLPKYNPIDTNGDGLEMYLAKISNEMASILKKHLKIGDDFLEKILINDDSLHEEMIENLEEDIEKEIMQDTTIDTTEVDSIVKSRKGHGKFKKNLEAIEKECRFTKISDKKLLIASHIKAWRFCENNFERLDGNNGLLLTPTYDRLFDRGYISFSNEGDIIISEIIDKKDYKSIGLDKTINIGSFNNKQKKYLEFHRNLYF